MEEQSLQQQAEMLYKQEVVLEQKLYHKLVSQSLGDRVVGINFVPFIRSRTISFTAQGMRPNTRVFPFFDEQAITAYVTPTGGSLGGNIITDANGAVSGTLQYLIQI